MNRLPLQGLSPEKVWSTELEARIRALTPDSGNEYALCVKTGLHLWNDSLHASHALSQNIHNVTGSYWHGIMHRMEPDYSNAKYWFRRVGEHPVFPKLRDSAREWYAREGRALLAGSCPPGPASRLDAWLSADSWDPFGFIDLVSESRRLQAPGLTAVLERIQRLEIAWLLQYSYEQYCGGTLFETISA